VDRASLGIFGALPASFPHPSGPATAEQIALGKMLYFEPRLSKNHDISCNTCHDLARFGVDGEETSPGHKKVRGGRNSPTSLNAAGHFIQFWDGRAKDVEEQALGPIVNPVEMAMPSADRVVATLRSIPEYEKAFKMAFPGEKSPVRIENVGRAIGAFERQLVTPAPFDAFINGDDNALTDAQKQGLNIFLQTGCQACHMGPLLGGTMFQKLGLVKPWPDDKDQGRFDVTKSDPDRFMFKVPSLRNVAQTGPYFHDGKTATLSEAVEKMAAYQLGRTLTTDQAKSIATFLGSLTGTLDPALSTPPVLPKSTAKTPPPDPS